MLVLLCLGRDMLHDNPPDNQAVHALRDLERNLLPEDWYRHAHEERTQHGPESPNDRDDEQEVTSSAEVELREYTQVLQQDRELAKAERAVIRPLRCPEVQTDILESFRVKIPLEPG